jgi:6,7-dimethyl-8-ribityllumazine synthase
VQKTYNGEIIEIPGARVAILQSKWYSEYTDTMVSRCEELLRKAGAESVEVHRSPGSLELPVMAEILLKDSGKRFDAIVCFGAVMRGETYHFTMVADECTRGLGEVSRAHRVPIISEVLAVETLDQLIARTGDNDQNKGIEAAQAAMDFIAWRRSLG